MGALLNNMTDVDEEDDAGVAHHVEAVGNSQDRHPATPIIASTIPTAHATSNMQRCLRRLHSEFTLGVEGAPSCSRRGAGGAGGQGRVRCRFAGVGLRTAAGHRSRPVSRTSPVGM